MTMFTKLVISTPFVDEDLESYGFSFIHCFIDFGKSSTVNEVVTVLVIIQVKLSNAFI